MEEIHSEFIKLPEITRDSVQGLSDKYVGRAITQSLVQSIDGEIEHRRRLLEHGYLPIEEIYAIENEIKYLNKLAVSLY